MDHQAADDDVVVAVGRVDGFGDSFREGAFGEAGDTACAGDDLPGGIDSEGGAAGGDGLGHDAGEVAGAASDVEDPVAWAGAAEGRQLGENTASAAAEEDGGEHVIAAPVPYEHVPGSC